MHAGAPNALIYDVCEHYNAQPSVKLIANCSPALTADKSRRLIPSAIYFPRAFPSWKTS